MPDIPVPESVLQKIWAMRPVYNGMTHVELAKLYGNRVYHVIGDGWYLKEGTAMSTASVKVLLDSDDQGKPGELPAFAWPGAYTMFYVTEEGDMLCAECATRDLTTWLAETRLRNGAAEFVTVDPPVAYGAFGATDDYPEDDERCANCNTVICGASRS